MKRIAIILAALALAPLMAGCNRGGSGEAAASVTIPFAPPLGQPLYYRFQLVTDSPASRRTRQSLFVVTFSRDADGLIMAVSALRPNGARASETGAPALVADRRFRVGAGGDILAMENEPAYWAAIERHFSESGPTEETTRDSRATLETIRANRALPTSDRMGILMRDAWPITFFAGHTYTREPRDTPAWKRSIYGEIDGIRRTFAREISTDRIVIVENFTITPRRMQTALDNIAARNGRRPEGIGSRHISNAQQVVVVLDAHTGLVRRREDRHELTSEEAGRRMRERTVELLEQVAAPRPAPPQRQSAESIQPAPAH